MNHHPQAKNKRLKYILEDNGGGCNNNTTEYLLVLDHKRTNNNRIANTSKLLLILIYYFLMISFPLAVLAKANPFPAPLPLPVSPTTYSKAYENIYNHKNHNSNNNNSTTFNSKSNANRTISSKSYSSTSQVTSISRPFYAKITSDDAVAKKPYFQQSSSTSTTTKKPKTTKKGKFQTKPSKLFSTAPLMADDSKDTTEKSFSTSTSGSTNANNHNHNSPISSSFLTTNSDSGPKIRLEPFFNLLTNFQSLALGTSKEQKFSPSYQTITQSIDESTKKSQANRSTKGMREKKKRNNKKHNRNKSSHGPIPIPIPKPIVNIEHHEESEMDSGKVTLHPMDVLNIPMLPMSKGSPEVESLASLESITTPSHGPYDIIIPETKPSKRKNSHKNTAASRSADTKNKIPISNATKSGEGPESRERRLRSDFLENFHDKDVDLQADETEMAPTVMEPLQEENNNPARVRPDTGRHVNIPQGYAENSGGPPFFSTIYHHSSGNEKKEDINMISKYPVSFAYDSNNNNNYYSSPPALGIPPTRYPHIPLSYPSPKNSKLRPNLHSYYDPNYHNNAGGGQGESSNNIYSNYPPTYGNHPPGFNNFGSHYVGHHLPSGPSSSYHNQPHQSQDVPPSHTNYNGDQKPLDDKPAEATSDLTEQGSSSDSTFDVDKTVVNSNQKIGIMGPFEIFYKEYKLLAWASFFVLTFFAILSLLVYLYVNNPPTEVVTARGLQYLDSLMSNPQIIKFLSSFVENNNTSEGTGRQKRRRFKSTKPSTGIGQQLFTAIKKDL